MENLIEKFNIIEKIEQKDGSIKYLLPKNEIKNCISFLKNSAESSADMLISVKAVDWVDKIELVYELYSTLLNKSITLATNLDSGNPVADSVVSLFKSASFDEREIFDLFGVEFDGHNGIKRLFLPKGTVGNPLLKKPCFKDERLMWND